MIFLAVDALCGGAFVCDYAAWGGSFSSVGSTVCSKLSVLLYSGIPAIARRIVVCEQQVTRCTCSIPNRFTACFSRFSSISVMRGIIQYCDTDRQEFSNFTAEITAVKFN